METSKSMLSTVKKHSKDPVGKAKSKTSTLGSSSSFLGGFVQAQAGAKKDSGKDPISLRNPRISASFGPSDCFDLNDVLFGRDYRIHSSEGNKRFRALVDRHRVPLCSLKYGDKALILQHIVHTVQDRGGRFLDYDSEKGMWVEVSLHQATLKAYQTFRTKPKKRSITSAASFSGAARAKSRQSSVANATTPGVRTKSSVEKEVRVQTQAATLDAVASPNFDLGDIPTMLLATATLASPELSPSYDPKNDKESLDRMHFFDFQPCTPNFDLGDSPTMLLATATLASPELSPSFDPKNDKENFYPLHIFDYQPWWDGNQKKKTPEKNTRKRKRHSLVDLASPLVMKSSTKHNVVSKKVSNEDEDPFSLSDDDLSSWLDEENLPSLKW